jgi:hypothetical protein
VLARFAVGLGVVLLAAMVGGIRSRLANKRRKLTICAVIDSYRLNDRPWQTILELSPALNCLSSPWQASELSDANPSKTTKAGAHSFV